MGGWHVPQSTPFSEKGKPLALDEHEPHVGIRALASGLSEAAPRSVVHYTIFILFVDEVENAVCNTSDADGCKFASRRRRGKKPQQAIEQCVCTTTPLSAPKLAADNSPLRAPGASDPPSLGHGWYPSPT